MKKIDVGSKLFYRFANWHNYSQIMGSSLRLVVFFCQVLSTLQLRVGYNRLQHWKIDYNR